MNDAATLFGKPKPLSIGGKTYLLHPLNFDDHGEVQAWLDAQQRDVFAIAQQQIASGRFSVEIQKFMIKSALEIAARSRIYVGTPEADAMLDTIEGKAEMLYLSIKKGDPSFTYDKAMGLLRQMDLFSREQAAVAADVMRADEDPKDLESDGLKENFPGVSARLSTGGPSSEP